MQGSGALALTESEESPGVGIVVPGYRIVEIAHSTRMAPLTTVDYRHILYGITASVNNKHYERRNAGQLNEV